MENKKTNIINKDKVQRNINWKTILISGGNGKFSRVLIETNTKYKILALMKKMNVLSLKSISNFISKHKIDYFIHAAAFSTPWRFTTSRKRSIETNIIGSANVALSCLKKILN